jgi:molybdopterin/thiamine biosynthesis adenylyltransferase
MTQHPLPYDTLVTRNDGYVTPEAQDRLRRLRVLIAGCGIGSSFAELAVRMGIEHIILADGDTVGETNLNRQFFSVTDVGNSKVKSLAARLRAINPAALITEVDQYLDKDNTAALVSQADLVFDTIDFLDLGAIVGLHDECRRQQKPVITALAVGWGAGCIYFPPGGPHSFRRLFGLPETGPIDHIPYTVAFGGVMQRFAAHLDPTVVAVVARALTVMEDGTPCPASQVAPGAFAVAALAGSMVHRLMSGLPVREAPELLIAQMPETLTAPGLNLLD